MDRCIWKARVLPGKLAEYEKRHREIWPEMAEILRSCGITNYTIWNNGSELIGYYECQSLEYADRLKAESEVVRRWGESMRGIMELVTDPETGGVLRYRQIFEFN